MLTLTFGILGKCLDNDGPEFPCGLADRSISDSWIVLQL